MKINNLSVLSNIVLIILDSTGNKKIIMRIEYIFNQPNHFERVRAAIDYCSEAYKGVNLLLTNQVQFQFPVKKTLQRIEFNHQSFEEGTSLLLPQLAMLNAKYGDIKYQKYIYLWKEFYQYMERAIRVSKDIEELKNFYEIFHSYAA